jgi:hypothetical protein
MTMMLALATSACAVPVDDEAEVAEVAQTAEALNLAADFQVGIMGIKYDAAGHANKSTQAWTAPISSMAGLSTATSDSPFTSALVNPTGFRVGLKSLGTGPSILQFVDFRLRIQARDSVNGVVGPVESTGWASEWAGTRNFSSGLSEMYYKPGYNQFRIGIEIRWWPAQARPTEIYDFRLGGAACGEDLFATCWNPPIEETLKPLSALAPGEVTWSHTVTPSDDGGPISFLELMFWPR